MRSEVRRRAVHVALAALCAAGALAATTGIAAARRPVTLTAAFGADATLGSSTALDVGLRLNPRRLTRAPVTEVRFAYPRSLGVVSSGLGLATCSRPSADFVQVLISAGGLAGCSPNAVMGIGTARALVRLTDGQVIPEYATLTLLSGELMSGRLGLVVYVDGQHPFGGKLALAGDVRGARAPYGGRLTIRLPPIPNLRDLATISVVELHLAIGSHAIRYYERRHGRRVAYHPEGIALPASCPAEGFRFRVDVGFADHSWRSAATSTPCPSLAP